MHDLLQSCRYYFGYAFFFSMFVNILQLTFSIYMLQVYDKVLTSYNLSTLVVITFAAILSLIVLAILEWVRSRLLVRAGIEFDNVLSIPVLHENIHSSSKVMGEHKHGTIRDVQLLRNFLGGNAVFAFFDAPWMPIYFLLIFILHPALGCVALIGAIAVLALGILTERATRKVLDSATIINNHANNFSTSILRNAGTIRAMGMVESMSNRWLKMNSKVIDLQTRASSRAGFLHAIGKSMRVGLQVLIYAVGAYLAIMQESTAGVMIAASIIMGRALAPIDLAMGTYKQSLEAYSAYKRLGVILDMPPQPDTMDLPPPSGNIGTENLYFSVAGRPIIKGVSFRLPAGQSLALIGPSASGKSTLCKLLLGIWPVTAGKVRIDGADITTWDMEKLGSHIGYLPQDVELFNGTIAENIARMGNVCSEKTIQAAQLAGVHELILKLPKGYDTRVGEQNILSGGQRQRIGLARALYDSPHIVVLDEPNSNLDEEGEIRLLQTLKKLKENKITVILVTHKQSIFCVVDNIIVLNDGQIAMSGSRNDVLSRIAAMQKQKNAKPTNSDTHAINSKGNEINNTYGESRYGYE